MVAALSSADTPPINLVASAAPALFRESARLAQASQVDSIFAVMAMKGSFAALLSVVDDGLVAGVSLPRQSSEKESANASLTAGSLTTRSTRTLEIDALLLTLSEKATSGDAFGSPAVLHEGSVDAAMRNFVSDASTVLQPSDNVPLKTGKK
jgi:hypothetical protein